MEKQQEASAPPTLGDAPPPYPGTGVGGFAPPPAGKNCVYFMSLRTYYMCVACRTICISKGFDHFQVNMHRHQANIPLSHPDTFRDRPLFNHLHNR